MDVSNDGPDEDASEVIEEPKKPKLVPITPKATAATTVAYIVDDALDDVHSGKEQHENKTCR